jgi:hypothetical protein
VSVEQAVDAHAPQPGVYRHYKGKLYDVLGTAVHSETGERLVVYRPQYGERGLWVRPLSMFTETLEIDGKPVARFAALAGDPAESTQGER